MFSGVLYLTYLSAVLMGILQGIAEFLPISSSGHLALFQHFFGMENFEETQMFFSVMLHFGTFISVCVYYFQDILEMICEFFRMIRDLFTPRGRRSIQRPPAARRLVLLIILATMPLFLVLPVKDLVEEVTQSVTFVSCALLVTGFLLFFSDRMARGRKNEKSALLRDALLVGVAQGFGTLPGISRSGITISAGLMCGFSRTFAVRFSFLMSLPAVLGATILELKDALEVGVAPELIPMCAVGMAVSCVVGYIAIRLVNLLSSKGKFGAFAWYCWLAGIASLVANFILK